MGMYYCQSCGALILNSVTMTEGKHADGCEAMAETSQVLDAGVKSEPSRRDSDRHEEMRKAALGVVDRRRTKVDPLTIESLVSNGEIIAVEMLQMTEYVSVPAKDYEWAVAQLRHLYVQMLNGDVKDCTEAARGLLGPAIERLEIGGQDAANAR